MATERRVALALNLTAIKLDCGCIEHCDAVLHELSNIRLPKLVDLSIICGTVILADIRRLLLAHATTLRKVVLDTMEFEGHIQQFEDTLRVIHQRLTLLECLEMSAPMVAEQEVVYPDFPCFRVYPIECGADWLCVDVTDGLCLESRTEIEHGLPQALRCLTTIAAP